MKSLNKTETPIFLSVVYSLFPKAIFCTFILLPRNETTDGRTTDGRIDSFQKLTELHNIKAHTKFGENRLIFFGNENTDGCTTDGRTDGRTTDGWTDAPT